MTLKPLKESCYKEFIQKKSFILLYLDVFHCISLYLNIPGLIVNVFNHHNGNLKIHRKQKKEIGISCIL